MAVSIPVKPSTRLLHPALGEGVTLTGITGINEKTSVKFNGERHVLSARDILETYIPAYTRTQKTVNMHNISVFNHTLILTPQFYDALGAHTSKKFYLSPSFRGNYLTINSQEVVNHLRVVEHRAIEYRIIFVAIDMYKQTISREVNLLKLNHINFMHSNIGNQAQLIRQASGHFQLRAG